MTAAGPALDVGAALRWLDQHRPLDTLGAINFAWTGRLLHGAMQCGDVWFHGLSPGPWPEVAAAAGRICPRCGPWQLCGWGAPAELRLAALATTEVAAAPRSVLPMLAGFAAASLDPQLTLPGTEAEVAAGTGSLPGWAPGSTT